MYDKDPAARSNAPEVIKFGSNTLEIDNLVELADYFSNSGAGAALLEQYVLPQPLRETVIHASNNKGKLELSAAVTFDPLNLNHASLAERFKRDFINVADYSFPSAKLGLSQLQKPFGNVVAVNSERSGLQAYVGIFNENGAPTIKMGNECLFTGGEQDGRQRRFELVARQIATVNPEAYIKDFLALWLSVASSVSTETDYLRSLKLPTLRVDRPFQSSIISSPRRKPAERTVPKPSEQTQPTSYDELEQLAEVKAPGEQMVRLSDIGGLEAVKQQLEAIALSFKHPDVMTKWGAKRAQGILLYGPPGTGKTMLVEALANEIEADLWQIKATDIAAKWYGESEANMKAIFDKARCVKRPTVVLFDEFDSIVQAPDEAHSGADRARQAEAGIFKQELNTLAKENPNVILVATTNHKDRIDPALIRSGRFDAQIYVPLPDAATRADIWSIKTASLMHRLATTEFNPFSDDINVPELVEQTDGMSGADIENALHRVLERKAFEEAKYGAGSPIAQSDILVTIRSLRQS